MKYQAVWITEQGATQLGVLTDLENAGEEVRFLTAVGRVAWLQDEEGNKVNSDGKHVESLGMVEKSDLKPAGSDRGAQDPARAGRDPGCC